MSEHPPSPTARRSWLRRLLNRLEVDKAVFIAVVMRVWQLLAGFVTALLMTVFFTKQVQGFYYTFSSLVALQSFFELGFNIVVVNLCSHEWAKLRIDERGGIAGDEHSRSRLVSLGRMLVGWYVVAGLCFIAIVSAAGFAFLGANEVTTIAWQVPWLVLVLLTGGSLALVPFHAVLEGCNQVLPLSVYRFLQTVASSLSVWFVMSRSGELWAIVAAAAARFGCDAIFLGGWYGRFFASFRNCATTSRVDWWTEVWPLQWRIGVMGVFAYFLFSLFTPVMFRYHGEELAAEMGMTWTVISAIQAAAFAWVQMRGPRFGMLVRRGDYRELNRIAVRLTLLAGAAFTIAGLAFWSLLVGLRASHGEWSANLIVKTAHRLLAPQPTAWLLVGAQAQLFGNCLAVYVRAFKREPFIATGFVSALLSGLGIWLLGWKYGATGAAIAFCLVQVAVVLPAILLIAIKIAREHSDPKAHPIADSIPHD